MTQQPLASLCRAQIHLARFFLPHIRPRHQFIHQQITRNVAGPSIRFQPARRGFSVRSRLRDGEGRASEPMTKQAEVSKPLSQRLKDLSKEYGWTAVGTYFALSALDFPFCFLAVRAIGAEKIAAVEHSVVEWVKRASPVQIPEKYRFWKKTATDVQGETAEQSYYNHGIEEAEIANKGSGASLGTQLALAYAIHKSFIFVRVPLTAAILPKIVKTLRGWGWKVGNKPMKVGKKPTKIDPAP